MADTTIGLNHDTVERLNDQRGDGYLSHDEYINGVLDVVPSMGQMEEGCTYCGKDPLNESRIEESNGVIRWSFHEYDDDEFVVSNWYCSPECAKKAEDEAKAHVPRHPDKVLVGGKDELRAEVEGATFLLGEGVFEAVAVGPDWLVPSTSIGHTPAYVGAADRLIVEVNRAQPLALARVHDVHVRAAPPNREPIPLADPLGETGGPTVRFDPDALAAVVETDRPDDPYEFRAVSDTDEAIAANLGAFLEAELDRNPLLEDAVNIQFGVGSLGNALMGALADVEFGDRDVAYVGEVVQDGLLDMLDTGDLRGASATSLALSSEGQHRLFADVERYAEDVVLRPADVSNAPELIDRFGVVGVNSAVEVDLYGNANATHVRGTRVVNGIGGGGDFARNCRLGVVALPSTAVGGDVSRIVPLTPHVDHTEHDASVVVTEHGVADLRGLSPRERAAELVAVADPSFRDDLSAYRTRAAETGGNTPHDLPSAFSWHSTDT